MELRPDAVTLDLSEFLEYKIINCRQLIKVMYTKVETDIVIVNKQNLS